MKFKVITLDVWGHGPDTCEKWGCPGGDRCEGYTVNAAYHTGRSIEVENTEIATLLKALVDNGELLPKCLEPGVIEIQGDDETTLYVNDGSDGQPLLQLENVDDA